METRKIDKIVPYDRNPRKNKDAVEHVLECLRKHGQVKPLVLSAIDHPFKNEVVCCGHTTLDALKQFGAKEVKVIIQEFKSESEFIDYNIRDNKSGEFALWDNDLLVELGSNFDVNLEEMGFDLDFSEPFDGSTDPDEIPEVTKSICKLGDLWQLGEHRLLCGDSTDKAQVERLMDNKKADMVFTDPPYLMDFTGNISWDEKRGAEKTYNAKHGRIKNDKMSKEDGQRFLDDINRNIIEFVNGAFYITFYRLGIDMYYESMKRVGLKSRSLIVWNKGNHTLSNSDYMSKYEPIFYGWVNDHNFYGGNNGMDIWDIERTKKNELHPTMKPVELVEKAILDGSVKDGLVLDLFLGSGSTLIACEKTNRICYGLELDEHYCTIIIKRWEDFTEKKAKRVES